MAEPLTSVSPTRLSDLLTCPARVKLTLDAAADTHAGAPARHEPLPHDVGIACHQVLERLLLAGQLGDDDAFERAWSAEVQGQRPPHPEADNLDDPRGLALTKVRLRRALARSATLLDEDPGETVVEPWLASSDDRIRGRPDIVVRGPNHWLADLKTGRIRASPDDPINPDYTRQLQLYAYLEHQTTGVWPTHAWLITLQGHDQRIELSPAECEATATQARRAIDDFNTAYPNVDARPTRHSCRWCRHLGQCPAPWKDPSMDWGDTAAAVLRLTHVREGIGEVWLEGDVLAGNLDEPAVSLRRIRTHDHPIAVALAPEDTIAAVGVRWSEAARAWQLPQNGRLIHVTDAVSG